METDLARAEAMLERALALDPGYSDARNNLALLFARTGRDDEAEATLRASLAADPSDIPAMVNLAVFLRDRRHNYTGTTRASTACSCSPTARPSPPPPCGAEMRAWGRCVRAAGARGRGADVRRDVAWRHLHPRQPHHVRPASRPPPLLY